MVKQGLKRKAAESHVPTKYLVAEAVGGLNFETRAKLNCDLDSLHKMVRYSRAAAQQHPTNPTTLEDLVLPAPYITATSGEPLLLWDSGYTTQHRRSFLFGTPQNTSILQDAEHFIVDGTFKTSPNLMTQMVSVHGLLESKWHLETDLSLDPGRHELLHGLLRADLDWYLSPEPSLHPL